MPSLLENQHQFNQLPYKNDQQTDDRHHQGYKVADWNPVQFLDLKRLKEVVISYGMHSPCVKQILNSLATLNRIIPENRKDLAIAILEADPQLQGKTWQKEEARIIEQ